jgi:hypothetical protein
LYFDDEENPAEDALHAVDAGRELARKFGVEAEVMGSTTICDDTATRTSPTGSLPGLRMPTSSTPI